MRQLRAWGLALEEGEGFPLVALAFGFVPAYPFGVRKRSEQLSGAQRIAARPRLFERLQAQLQCFLTSSRVPCYLPCSIEQLAASLLTRT